MSENIKTLKARVQHKHKTEANWLKDIYSDVENQVFQTNIFRPLPGELIIYDRDENYDYERYKIGRQDPDEAEGVGLQLHLLEFVDGNINTLTTTNKNIVGAINELNKKVNESGSSGTDEGIIGTWIFNEEVFCDQGASYSFKFYSAGKIYDGMYLDIDYIDYFIGNYSTNNYESFTAYDASNGGWQREEYKTVDIIEEPAQDDYLPWLKGQAKKQRRALQTLVTYSELKALRDNSQLAPGMFYRITDYQCTTTQEDTRAMNNQFDIIVQALDVNKLSENASATWHEGDTYFADVNLAAWELKYSLENNTSRFAWADAENGKGVIYWMKDENNNECPYDFKNIQFKRYMIAEIEVDSINNLVDHYFGILDGYNYLIDESDYIWCYTFSWLNEDEEIEDLSIVGNNLTNDEGQYSGVYGNIINTISAYSKLYPDSPEYYGTCLNDIVCLSEWSYSDGYFSGCYSNIFGSDCQSNTLGNDCYCNIFGNNFNYNTFGDGCNNNTFGSDCYSNTFSSGCNSNTFGNHCNSNTFGNNCGYSTFGNECNFNTFGSNCSYNTFGNNCHNNTFGSNCRYITFGNNCYFNTFGNSNTDTISFVRFIHFENDCQYIRLLNSEIGNSYKIIQDITVSAGVKGTASAYCELQVSRKAAPVVFEAANTTHIILD